MEINPGDRVTTSKPGSSSTGVVKGVKDGWRRGRAEVEVEVEFHGPEWFYPYRAFFKPEELIVIGHAVPPG